MRAAWCWGHVGPTPVAVLQGRAHYYERGRIDEMAGAIQAMASLGCEILLQTNAPAASSSTCRPAR